MPDTVEAKGGVQEGLIRADDMVRTLVDVSVEGRVVPAGSLGRVAYADRGSGWHCVAFGAPALGTAFLGAGSVQRFDGVPPMEVPDALGLHQGGPVPPYPYQQLESVRTLVDVAEDGQVVPAGSRGTIVDVSPAGGHHEVEFTGPFTGPCPWVISLTAAQIAY